MVELLRAKLLGQELSRAQAREAMRKILAGEVRPEQIGAFLIALQCKGESAEEIVGFADALYEEARTVETDSANLLDICGTGGDGSGSFNISTTVAFVVAAAGQPLAKHGNRAVSSRSGSFDVLEKLKISFVSDPHNVREDLNSGGLSFLFAPLFHPKLGAVGPVRRSLGVRTVFNLLGPLLNPCRVRRQLIGVYSNEIMRPIAEALAMLGSREAMIVRGEDGLDELTLSGSTRIVHLKDGAIRDYRVEPRDFGLQTAAPSALHGGDAEENAKILLQVLAGEKGPRRDVVIMNTAAALVVGGKVTDFHEGVGAAQAAIDGGRALSLLREIQARSSARDENLAAKHDVCAPALRTGT